MVYAWPTAEIGMMDANQAAKIMYADADAATIREKAAEYKNLQSSPLSAAKKRICGYNHRSQQIQENM